LVFDGTVVRIRLDRKATAISLLIALGVRRDGQKVVLAIKHMGGERQHAWRAVLDDLTGRGLVQPDLVVDDGGKGHSGARRGLPHIHPDLNSGGASPLSPSAGVKRK
jgi:putative transposase